MAKLARFVFARDERGVLRSYGPDDEVPASVAKTITMPGVWDTDDATGAPAPKPKRRSPTKKTVKPTEGSVQESPDETPPAPTGADDGDDTDPEGVPDGDGVGTAGTE